MPPAPAQRCQLESAEMRSKRHGPEKSCYLLTFHKPNASAHWDNHNRSYSFRWMFFKKSFSLRSGMRNLPRVPTSSSAQLFLPGKSQWKAHIKKEKHSKNQADSFPHTLISTLPLSRESGYQSEYPWVKNITPLWIIHSIVRRRYEKDCLFTIN